MVDSPFRAIISVVDQTAAPLRVINDRLERMHAPVRNLGESFGGIGTQLSRLGTNTGLARLASSVGNAGRALGTLGGRVGSVLGMLNVPGLATLGGLAGTAATTGLGMLAFNTAKAAGDLSDLSARTGVAAEVLQRYQGVALRAGVDTDAVASSFQRLGRNMGDAAAGKNKDVAAIFRQLRIPLRDARGRVREVTAVLPALADAFSRTTNQATLLRAVTELFGKQGEALIPMLRQNGAQINETADTYARFRRIMSEGEVTAGAAADESFENLTIAVKGLGDAIGSRLWPVLGPIADEMAEWIVQNREWIGQGIGDAVRDLAGWLRKTNEEIGPEGWKQFRDGVRNAAVAIGDMLTKVPAFVKEIGGLQTILIGFAAVAALPFIAALGTIALSLGTVAFAAGRTLAAMRAVSAAAPGLAAAGVPNPVIPQIAQTAPATVARGLGGTLAGNMALFETMRRTMSGGDMEGVFTLDAARRRLRGEPPAPRPGLPSPDPAAAASPGAATSPQPPVALGESSWERLRRSLRSLDAGTGFDPSRIEAAAGPGSTNGLIGPRAGSQAGEVEVVVRFENLPQGATVTTETTGAGVGAPIVEVGRSMQGVR